MIDPADQMMRRLWLCLMLALCIAVVLLVVVGTCVRAGAVA